MRNVLLKCAHYLNNQILKLNTSLFLCLCVSVFRGQAGEGKWGDYSGENLFSSDHAHPEQVRGQFFFITYNVHILSVISFVSFQVFSYFFSSENILELSIMPKDEDVLQLVSVSIVFLLFSLLSFFSPCCSVVPLYLAIVWLLILLKIVKILLALFYCCKLKFYIIHLEFWLYRKDHTNIIYVYVPVYTNEIM